MNFNLGRHWEQFIADEIKRGRYLNQSEVVRAALQLLQQQRLAEFNAVFSDYPGAPPGEPTAKDQRDINRAIETVRSRKRKARKQAA